MSHLPALALPLPASPIVHTEDSTAFPTASFLPPSPHFSPLFTPDRQAIPLPLTPREAALALFSSSVELFDTSFGDTDATSTLFFEPLEVVGQRVGVRVRKDFGQLAEEMFGEADGEEVRMRGWSIPGKADAVIDEMVGVGGWSDEEDGTEMDGVVERGREEAEEVAVEVDGRLRTGYSAHLSGSTPAPGVASTIALQAVSLNATPSSPATTSENVEGTPSSFALLTPPSSPTVSPLARPPMTPRWAKRGRDASASGGTRSDHRRCTK